LLTDHQANMVEQLVASGRYQNASEVLREGLRLVEQREAEDAYRLEALRSAVQVGIDDIQAGRFKTFDSMESLLAHNKSLTAKRLAEALGVDEIQVIHLALHELATKVLPQYEADEGALTKAQLSQIKRPAPKAKGAQVRSSLVEVESTSVSGGQTLLHNDSNAMLDSAKFARRVAGDEALDRMAENARELGLDY
jgi:antitoxin ParD1/3/4